MNLQHGCVAVPPVESGPGALVAMLRLLHTSKSRNCPYSNRALDTFLTEVTLMPFGPARRSSRSSQLQHSPPPRSWIGVSPSDYRGRDFVLLSVVANSFTADECRRRVRPQAKTLHLIFQPGKTSRAYYNEDHSYRSCSYSG